jgi:hypothetical protein
MAMSKKELAEVDALRARLQEATSLRDLTLHNPVPIPVTDGSLVQEGLWWANTYSLLNWMGQHPQATGCVGLGRRKGGYSHSHSTEGSSFTQGPGKFYGSRKAALFSVRDDVVKKFAAALAAVDREIEKEPR